MVGQQYRSATDIIHEIVDFVSKNGNVLLNVPQHGDGSVDDEPLACLEDTGRWMEVNGEAIYGTRPWHVHGSGGFRFTTKGEVLYVLSPEAPKHGRFVVEALGRGRWGGSVRKVTAL